jgi:cell fate (sporulation/competence/biofilm development) regulator YmcA (YheA/YmcA/DUF963 family)
VSSIDKLKEYYLSIPEVKRLKELEHYIDHNEKIKARFSELKDIYGDKIREANPLYAQ